MDKYALGNFLAELRNEKGLTQEQLSEIINVNYKTISKWENGNSSPSLDTLAQLCEIYDVSLYEMSIYKRINNPFISKENIKKIINKNSIIKNIVLKIILILLAVLLLIITTYTFIYTINNYGQMAVYELKSDDNFFETNSLYVETNNEFYILISDINILDDKNNYEKENIEFLQYTLSLNNQDIESKEIKFDNNISLKDAISTIKINIHSKRISGNIDEINLTLKYEINKIDKQLTLKIIPSIKQSNNKLFY